MLLNSQSALDSRPSGQSGDQHRLFVIFNRWGELLDIDGGFDQSKRFALFSSREAVQDALSDTADQTEFEPIELDWWPLDKLLRLTGLDPELVSLRHRVYACLPF